MAILDLNKTEVEDLLRTAPTNMDDLIVQFARNQSLLHGALGLATEYDEYLDCVNVEGKVDKVNKMEELADMVWYMELIKSSRGLEFQITPKKIHIADIHKPLAEILDFAKRSVYYGHQTEERVEKFNANLKVINMFITQESTAEGYNYCDLARIVIDKLKVRYPDQFTGDKANNRNLNKERESLESSV